jgi:hypothetical protein
MIRSQLLISAKCLVCCSRSLHFVVRYYQLTHRDIVNFEYFLHAYELCCLPYQQPNIWGQHQSYAIFYMILAVPKQSLLAPKVETDFCCNHTAYCVCPNTQKNSSPLI